MNASRFGQSVVLYAVAMLFSLHLPVLGQDKASGRNEDVQAPAGEKGDAVETPFVLRMTVHEVVVTVVAIDQHNHPVSDMKENDFQVFEVGNWTRSRQNIVAFHMVDPAMPKPLNDAGPRVFRVRSDEGCAIGRRSHYEIAFHPSHGGWTGGYHEVLVTTSRPHVRLLFRRRYYVGETKLLSRPSLPDDPNEMRSYTSRPAITR